MPTAAAADSSGGGGSGDSWRVGGERREVYTVTT